MQSEAVGLQEQTHITQADTLGLCGDFTWGSNQLMEQVGESHLSLTQTFVLFCSAQFGEKLCCANKAHLSVKLGHTDDMRLLSPHGVSAARCRRQSSSNGFTSFYPSSIFTDSISRVLLELVKSSAGARAGWLCSVSLSAPFLLYAHLESLRLLHQWDREER